jgi:hypothetical protein
MRSGNPRVDVDDLERRIDAELARDPAAAAGDERLARLAATVHARAIEAHLDAAEARSQARTEWPAGVRIPLVSSSAFLRRAALRVLALAFRDQHEANAALIRSQRELLALVQTLAERVAALEGRLDDERAAARAQAVARREGEGT